MKNNKNETVAYKCDLCDRSFKTKARKTRHIKNTHKVDYSKMEHKLDQIIEIDNNEDGNDAKEHIDIDEDIIDDS